MNEAVAAKRPNEWVRLRTKDIDFERADSKSRSGLSIYFSINCKSNVF